MTSISQIESSAKSKLLSLLFAADDGYGDTNTARFARTKEGKVVINCHRQPSFLMSGLQADETGVCCEVNGNANYTFSRRLKNADSRIDIFNDDYPGSAYNAALIAAALNQHGIELPDDGYIVTGLPVSRYYDLRNSQFKLVTGSLVEKKKNNLAAHNSIRAWSANSTSEYSFPVDNHFIVPEAVGVLIDILFEDFGDRKNDWIFEGLSDDAFVLTVDMGSRTTDICGMTHKLKPVKETLQTINVGLNDVHARFKDFLLGEDNGQLCYQAGLTATSLSDDKIRTLFNEGFIIKMRSREREKVSIRHLAERAFSSVVRDDIMPKLQYLKEDLSRVAAVILAGGGAAISGYLQQSMRAQLEVDMDVVQRNVELLAKEQPIKSDSVKGNVVLCAPSPEFANVRGFLKWAAFIKFKLTLSDLKTMKDALIALE